MRNNEVREADVSATLPKIEINPDLEIRREPMTERFSCVVVDDFLQNPEQIVAFACSHAADFSIPDRSYPGMVLELDADPLTDVYRFIRSTMSKHFSFFRGGLKLSTLLSMATLQPDELSNLQRLCHTDPRDRMDRENFAALLYLFRNEELGGTGFYRWKERELIERATAIEQEDPDAALAFLKKHFPTYGRPACYMTKSNEIAELIGMIPARFNRLIFYPGDLPHSASIASPQLLSKDLAIGRLTLNCFASVRPNSS